MKDRPGAINALSRAAEIEASHPEFSLAECDIIEQGANNLLLPCKYNNTPAVLKYFDDCINKPGAYSRKQIESIALRNFSAIDQVPQIFLEFDDSIIMERKPGKSLQKTIRDLEQSPDENFSLDEIGTNCGILFSQFASIQLTTTDQNELRNSMSNESIVEYHPEVILSYAPEICRKYSSLNAQSYSISIIKDELSNISVESPIICRYDNNFGNFLIVNSSITGLVDFEQCFIGNEAMLLGSVLDTFVETYPLFPNRPSWNAFIAGYKQSRSNMPYQLNLDHVPALAMLNHWYRIVDTYLRIGSLDRHIDRFTQRFPTLLHLHNSKQL